MAVSREDTRVGHVVRVANLEGTVDVAVVSKCVVRAPHLVVDVLAVFSRFGSYASTEAELRGTDEGGPLLKAVSSK